MRILFIFLMVLLPMNQYSQNAIQHDQLEKRTEEAASSGEYMYLFEDKPYTGLAETRYADGYLFQTNYKEGKKHGKEISFFKGNKTHEMEYSNGIPVGDIKSWYSNGKLHYTGKGAEILKENVRIVDSELSRKYLSDTLPLSELVSADYFYEGEWIYYHENGRLKMFGNYKPVGYIEVSTSESFDSDGIISVEVSQPEGSREGWWKLYDDKGMLLRMEYYENDELLEEKWH